MWRCSFRTRDVTATTYLQDLRLDVYPRSRRASGAQARDDPAEHGETPERPHRRTSANTATCGIEAVRSARTGGANRGSEYRART